MPTPFSPATLARLQAAFVALVLPRILAHGHVSFRRIQCPHRQEDALQEMIGLAWQWHLDLAQKGKDATCFPTALACLAARAVKSGRRLCGHERARDVLSPLAQQRHHFAVSKLPDFESLADHLAAEAWHDNTKSPPEEALCFESDFAARTTCLTERNRGIEEDRMIGERTLDVADKYDDSPGRIAQLRREFSQSWPDFYGDGGANSLSNRPGLV